MTDRERAIDYIRIFIGLGDKWRSSAPVDGEPTERGLRIGTVEVWPGDDGAWHLDDGEKHSRFEAVSS